MSNLPIVFEKARKQWGGNGSGSTNDKTEALRFGLTALLKELDVETVLDVGCGTYGWMADVVAESGVDYVGVDVAVDAIEWNKREYPDLVFETIATVDDDLPEADLVIVRDVLAHLSNENVRRLLLNVKNSGAKFLLVTTFPRTMRNQDCQDGRYRPLSLMLRPFQLPQPARTLEDSDNKVMALWNTSEL